MVGNGGIYWEYLFIRSCFDLIFGLRNFGGFGLFCFSWFEKNRGDFGPFSNRF